MSTMIFTVLPPLCSNLITTHEHDAMERVLEQYKGAKYVEGIISLVGQRAQEMEGHLCQMEHLDIVDACEGNQLDMLGADFGVERKGLDDDRYRLVLKARIAVTHSSGTTEDLIYLWGLLSGAKDIQVVEKFPCAVEIFSDSKLIAGLEEFAKDLFSDALAGGVRLDVTYYQTYPFAVDIEPEDPTTGGFGDENDPAVGGMLSTLIV